MLINWRKPQLLHVYCNSTAQSFASAGLAEAKTTIDLKGGPAHLSEENHLVGGIQSLSQFSLKIDSCSSRGGWRVFVRVGAMLCSPSLVPGTAQFLQSGRSGPVTKSPSVPLRRASLPSLRFPLLRSSPTVVSMASSVPQQRTLEDEVDTAGGQEERKQSALWSFLRKEGANDELAEVIWHIQEACKRISALLASPTALPLSPAEEESIRAGSANGTRDIPKPLDIVSVC